MATRVAYEDTFGLEAVQIVDVAVHYLKEPWLTEATNRALEGLDDLLKFWHVCYGSVEELCAPTILVVSTRGRSDLRACLAVGADRSPATPTWPDRAVLAALTRPALARRHHRW